MWVSPCRHDGAAPPTSHVTRGSTNGNSRLRNIPSMQTNCTLGCCCYATILYEQILEYNSDSSRTDNERLISDFKMGPALISRSVSHSSSDEESTSGPSRPNSRHGTDTDSAYHSMDSDSEQSIKSVETQCDRDPIAQEFQTIARDILNAMYPVDPDWVDRSPHTRTVVRLVNEILSKHGAVYNSIVVKTIQATDFDKYHTSLSVMCDELFKGEIVTWGRILALFALCYQIAHHYRQHDRSRMEALLLCDFIGHYLGEKASKFVKEEGGWISLETAFPAKDAMEKRVWRSLLVTGLSLGVLATVIKVVR